MNERIKELAEQAGAVRYEVDVRRDTYPTNLEELEKFAELIIADAINTVEKRFMGDLNREDLEVRRCVEALKNHFGVYDEQR
jgi:hypothetical protein